MYYRVVPKTVDKGKESNTNEWIRSKITRRCAVTGSVFTGCQVSCGCILPRVRPETGTGRLRGLSVAVEQYDESELLFSVEAVGVKASVHEGLRTF